MNIGDRVKFIETGETGEVIAQTARMSPYDGDLAGPWYRVRYANGETFWNTNATLEPA